MNEIQSRNYTADSDDADFSAMIAQIQGRLGSPVVRNRHREQTDDCPSPMRLRRITLDAALMSEAEARHIPACIYCRRLQETVRETVYIPDSDTLLRYTLGDMDATEKETVAAAIAESRTAQQTLQSSLFQSRVLLARRERERSDQKSNFDRWKMVPSLKSQEPLPRLSRIRQHADTEAARQQQIRFADSRIIGSYADANNDWRLHIERRDAMELDGTLAFLTARDSQGNIVWGTYVMYTKEWRGVSVGAIAPKTVLADKSLHLTDISNSALLPNDGDLLQAAFTAQVRVDERRGAAYRTAWQRWAQIAAQNTELPESVRLAARAILAD